MREFPVSFTERDSSIIGICLIYSDAIRCHYLSGKGIPENNPAQVSHLDLRASYCTMVTGNILYSPTHFPDSLTHIETQTAVRQSDFTSWR